MISLRITIFLHRFFFQFLLFLLSLMPVAIAGPVISRPVSNLDTALLTGTIVTVLSIFYASLLKNKINKFRSSFHFIVFPMSKKMGLWLGLKRVMGIFLSAYIVPTTLILSSLLEGKLSILALNMCILHWLILILAFQAEALHYLFFPAKFLFRNFQFRLGPVLVVVFAATAFAWRYHSLIKLETMGELGLLIAFPVSFLSGMLYFSYHHPQYSILFTIVLIGILVPFLVLFVRDLLKPEDVECAENFDFVIWLENELAASEAVEFDNSTTSIPDDSNPQIDRKRDNNDGSSPHSLTLPDSPEYDTQSSPELQVLNYIRTMEGSHDLRRPPIERNYYKPLGWVVVFGLAAYALYPHFAPSPKSPLLPVFLFFRSAFSGQLIASPVGVPLRWIPIIRRIFWDDLKAYGFFDLLYCLICSYTMTQGFALTPLFFIASCLLRLTSYVYIIAADMENAGWKAPRNLLTAYLIGFILIFGSLYANVAFERDFLDRMSHYLMQLTISFFVLVAVQSILAMIVLFAIHWKTRLNVMDSSHNPYSLVK